MTDDYYVNHKFLFITHELSRTGAPIVLLDVIRMLHDEGNYIEVISLEDGPLRNELEKMNIQIQIQKRFLPIWEEFYTTIKNYDCVFCNTLLVFESIYILNLSNIPTIWWIHEAKEYFDMFQDMLPDLSTLNPNIHILSVSPVTTDILKEFYQCDADGLTFGIDDVAEFTSFSPKSTESQNCNATSMNNYNNRVKFITIGLYCYAKGQDILAAAISKLPPKILTMAEFYFCGDLEHCDEDYVEPVRLMEKNTHSVFVLPSMAHNEILKTIAKMDFLIVPSRLEPMPTVACEALMQSVPVILSDICGVARLIKDSDGFLFPSEDVNALKDTIINAIYLKRFNSFPEASKYTYQQMSASARESYEKKFSKQVFKKRFHHLLADLFPKKRLIFINGLFDILDIFSYELMKAFESFGYEVMEINRHRLLEDLRKFEIFYEQGNIKAVFTFNFHGAFFETSDGSYFWNRFHIPIINILMDHPFCFHEELEHVLPGSVMISPDRNHMNYMLRFYPNITTAGFYGHGGIQKYITPKPIAERDIDVLYAGAISRPNIAKVMPDFSKFDFDAEAIGNEAYEVLIKNPHRTTEDVLEETLLKNGIVLPDESLRQVIADMHYVDLLAVSYFRERTIKSLCEAGIHVTLYGFGWETLDWVKEMNVDFRGRISAYEIIDLMADSKIVLSTMTWFKDGTHDRVFNGMLQGACTVTDTSVYMTEEFNGIYTDSCFDSIHSNEEPEIVFFHLEQIDTLPAFIKNLLADNPKMQAIADAGRKKAAASHTWNARARELESELLQFL